jgi:hypothetical protein
VEEGGAYTGRGGRGMHGSGGGRSCLFLHGGREDWRQSDAAVHQVKRA